jgi:hypothetical protein
MFLLLTIWCGAMFELVQSAFEGRDNLPGSSELVGQFVNTFFGCIRSNGTAGEYNVANRVCARIQMTGIDELTMVSVVFLDKQLGDFAKGRKMCGKVL